MDRLKTIRARFSELLAVLEAAAGDAPGPELEQILSAVEQVQDARRRFYREPFPEV